MPATASAGPPPLRAAVVRLSATEDAAACLEQATEAVADAARAGAQLAVLPEYASGWTPTVTAALAQPADGAFVTALRRSAREHRIAVLAGVMLPAGSDLVRAAVPDGDGRAANVTLAIDADGTVVGAYTKVHLFDAFGVQESAHLVPGVADGEPLVVDVGGLRVGVLTCYDLRFPESARRLVDAGADVIAVGAAWAAGPGKAEQLEVLARARAIENTAYLLLACQGGRGRTGRSAVIDPRGQVVTDLPGGSEAVEPAVASADLDRGVVDKVRTQVPSLEHRRFAVVARDGQRTNG